MEGMTSIPPAMLEFPAAMPPDGVIPNYANPHSYGYQLVASTSVLLAIMILFLINRVYVKVFIVRDWSWDDITCGISAILTTTYYAVSVYEVRYCYLGVHFWDLKLGEFMQDHVLIANYVIEVLSSPTLGVIKLTFFLLFLQIFSPTRSMRWACYIGFICTFLAYSGFTIAWFVIGTPGPGVTWVAQFMGPTQKGNALDYPIPVIGLIFDIYILILPLVGVSKLQLSFRRKMGVVLIFTTAILAVIASILRIVYTVPLAENQPGDFTYNLMVVYITIIVEMMLGVILCCVPSFSRMCNHHGPSFKSYKTKFFSSFRTRTGRISSSHSSENTFTGKSISKPYVSEKYRQIRDPFNTKVSQVSQWELEHDNFNDVSQTTTVGRGETVHDLESQGGVKVQSDIVMDSYNAPRTANPSLAGKRVPTDPTNRQTARDVYETRQGAPRSSPAKPSSPKEMV